MVLLLNTICSFFGGFLLVSAPEKLFLSLAFYEFDVLIDLGNVPDVSILLLVFVISLLFWLVQCLGFEMYFSSYRFLGFYNLFLDAW
jgi:hypothetical protein